MVPWNIAFRPGLSSAVVGEADSVKTLGQLQSATSVGQKALALANRRYSTVPEIFFQLLSSLKRLGHFSYFNISRVSKKVRIRMKFQNPAAKIPQSAWIPDE